MAATARRLDARQAPPEQLKTLFKKYQKATMHDLDNDASIIDLESSLADAQVGIKRSGTVPLTEILRAFEHLSNDAASNHPHSLASQVDAPIYEVQGLPGILIIPSLLSPSMQIELLNRLLHRDLVDPNHKTNLHLHYDVSYHASATKCNVLPQHDQQPPSRHQTAAQEANEQGRAVLESQLPRASRQVRQSQQAFPWGQSLFCADLSTTFQPKDPHIHKELSLVRALEKKLRWFTIGGQYDWTAKAYPQERPPCFPSDIAGVLRSLFPYVEPQAAILNFYSPGDTLSVHRDVSEECARGLISLSFGCDAIFVVGNEDGSTTATIRLRSGDALLMSQPSRFAWHGIPKVLAGTCPQWLEEWPLVGDKGSTYEQWRGWMAGKRINLNVRQMSEYKMSGCSPLSPPE